MATRKDAERHPSPSASSPSGPRLLTENAAVDYVGGRRNLLDLSAWVLPLVIHGYERTYDKQGLDSAIDRAKKEGWPGQPTDAESLAAWKKEEQKRRSAELKRNQTPPFAVRAKWKAKNGHPLTILELARVSNYQIREWKMFRDAGLPMEGNKITLAAAVDWIAENETILHDVQSREAKLRKAEIRASTIKILGFAGAEEFFKKFPDYLDTSTS